MTSGSPWQGPGRSASPVRWPGGPGAVMADGLLAETRAGGRPRRTRTLPSDESDRPVRDDRAGAIERSLVAVLTRPDPGYADAMKMRTAVRTSVLRCVALLGVAVSLSVGVALLPAKARGRTSVQGRPRQTIVHRPHRCAQVHWRTSRDHDQRCPSSHSVLADISYTNLHWTKWTPTRADGHGDELGFDDAPGPRPGSIVQALVIKLAQRVNAPTGDGFTPASASPCTRRS